MTMVDDKHVLEAVELLTAARRVCCLTGAGISAESGIPTFRGKGGFWAGRRAEDLATPESFAADPELVWRFYLWRRGLLTEKKPNPGHFALADIERRLAYFTLITQNVDSLHTEAGSRRVVELHGNIWIDRCSRCPRERRANPADYQPIPEQSDVSAEIPHCDECGAMMRPGVVWFGEMLPPDAVSAAQEAVTGCEVMLVVGTSAVVQPAASFAAWARSNGARIIEVNPETTPLSDTVDLRFAAPAGQVLPEIAKRLTAAEPSG